MDTRLVNPHDCQYVQSRVTLDVFAVAEYEDMMERGIVFEPCKGILCSDGAIIIYDGNHRAEAAKGNGAMIEVELTPGTDQDADWQASGANTRHGLRRTASDIEKSVKAALRHPNAQGQSDREIARHCGCDHKTVGKYRKELETSGERPQTPVKTVTRNGTDYQMTIPMPKAPDPEPEPPRTPSPMVFDAHMPRAVPAVDAQGHARDRQMVVARCLDCGEPFPRSEDRPDPQLCDDCGQVRLQERLTEARQRHELIPIAKPAMLEGVDSHPSTPAIEPESKEECDFCGKDYPVSQLYFSPEDCEAICRTCASRALHHLLSAKALDTLNGHQRLEREVSDDLDPCSCPDCGYKFQAVAVKFYADETSGIEIP